MRHSTLILLILIFSCAFGIQSGSKDLFGGPQPDVHNKPGVVDFTGDADVITPSYIILEKWTLIRRTSHEAVFEQITGRLYANLEFEPNEGLAENRFNPSVRPRGGKRNIFSGIWTTTAGELEKCSFKGSLITKGAFTRTNGIENFTIRLTVPPELASLGLSETELAVKLAALGWTQDSLRLMTVEMVGKQFALAGILDGFAKLAVVEIASRKQELAQNLLNEADQLVSDGKIPQVTHDAIVSLALHLMKGAAVDMSAILPSGGSLRTLLLTSPERWPGPPAGTLLFIGKNMWTFDGHLWTKTSPRKP